MSWRDIFLRSGGTSSDVGPSFNPAKPQSNARVGMRERLGTHCSDLSPKELLLGHPALQSPRGWWQHFSSYGAGKLFVEELEAGMGAAGSETNCSLPGVQLSGGHPWGPPRADTRRGLCAPRESGSKGSSARPVTLSRPVPLWQFYIFPVGTAL